MFMGVDIMGCDVTCCLPYLSTVTFSCSVWSHGVGVCKQYATLDDKIQHEGWGRVANTAQGEAECCICHKTTPRVLYFIVQHKYVVLLLICWCCVGGLILRLNPRSLFSPFSAGCFDRMDSQSDAEKQTDPVVSPSLLR